MKKIIKQNKKGFTLTEVLLVLALAATIIILIFMAYPKAKSAISVDRESKNISTILSGVKSMYASTSSFTGLTNNVALKAEIIPNNMIKKSTSVITTVKNSWSGVVVIQSDSTGPSGKAGSSFTITYNTVPTISCSKLVASVASYFYTVSINGVVVKPNNGVLDITETSKQCASNYTSNIIFTSI